MWDGQTGASLTIGFLPPVRRKVLAGSVETCCLVRLHTGQQEALVPETHSLMPRLLCGSLSEFSPLLAPLLCGLPTWGSGWHL